MQYLIALGGLVVLVSAILAAMGFHGRPQVVGIDLGTTFSVVALKATDGTVSIIPDHVTGKQLLPSVVTYKSDGKVLVGDVAVAQEDALRSEPSSTPSASLVGNWERYRTKVQSMRTEWLEISLKTPGNPTPPALLLQLDLPSSSTARKRGGSHRLM